MSDRNEPDWDAMANQRLYAYLDSRDPACEDCECEDPEHAESHTPTLDVRGMTDEQVAVALDEQEEVTCTCKCHNIPHDPRDDRPEPDDIPDWYPEGD